MLRARFNSSEEEEEGEDGASEHRRVRQRRPAGRLTGGDGPLPAAQAQTIRRAGAAAPPPAAPAPVDEAAAAGLQGPSDFRTWLFQLYAMGRLAASDITTGSWLAMRRRALNVADLALPPLTAQGRRQGGRSTRVVDAALGNHDVERRFHWARLPVHLKRGSRRGFRTLPFLLPHQTVEFWGRSRRSELLTTDPDVLAIPRIAESEILQRHGPNNTVLLRLYVDGVAYSGRSRSTGDSVTVWSWSPITGNPAQSPNFVIIGIRKQDMCHCGCSGRCTVEEVWRQIAVSCEILRGGVLDGTLFGDVRELGCDMAELPRTLGLKQWNSVHTPCPKCERTGQQLQDLVGDFPSRKKPQYDQAVQDGLVIIDASAADALVLQRALEQDLRQNGARGRALMAGVPALGLRAHDRLEVGGVITDIAQDLTQLAVFPARLFFWRHLATNFVRSPCVLLTQCLQLECIVCDLLHTVDLGVCQYCAGEIFAFILLGNGLGLEDRGNQEVLLRKGIAELERRLFLWYDAPGHRGRPTRVNYLTRNVLVGPDVHAPCVHAKGMESRWLFRFALEMARVCGDRLSHAGEENALKVERLLLAANLVEEFFTILYRNGPRVIDADCLRLVHISKMHCAAMRSVNAALKPKHHWRVEMCQETRWSGNPLFTSTYEDESFNMVISGVARGIHPRAFCRSLSKRLRALAATRGRLF